MNGTGGMLVAVVAGAVGTGYFVYGKKEGQAIPMLAGAALCVYPYFVDNPWLQALIGLALMTVPFLLRD